MARRRGSPRPGALGHTYLELTRHHPKTPREPASEAVPPPCRRAAVRLPATVQIWEDTLRNAGYMN